MPKYYYKCKSCLDSFEAFHGMNEDYEGCKSCGSLSIFRVPQMVHTSTKKQQESSKVGDEVRRAIEENRAILTEERKKRVELPDEL